MSEKEDKMTAPKNTDNVLRRYGYSYDKLNRLKKAVYQKPDNTNPVTNMYNESMTYDKNGNIQHLERNGDFDVDDTQLPLQIDQLVYSYGSSKKKQLMRSKGYQ
jgi:hypothetical protein